MRKLSLSIFLFITVTQPLIGASKEAITQEEIKKLKKELGSLNFRIKQYLRCIKGNCNHQEQAIIRKAAMVDGLKLAGTIFAIGTTRYFFNFDKKKKKHTAKNELGIPPEDITPTGSTTALKVMNPPQNQLILKSLLNKAEAILQDPLHTLIGDLFVNFRQNNLEKFKKLPNNLQRIIFQFELDLYSNITNKRNNFLHSYNQQLKEENPKEWIKDQIMLMVNSGKQEAIATANHNIDQINTHQKLMKNAITHIAGEFEKRIKILIDSSFDQTD